MNPRTTSEKVRRLMDEQMLSVPELAEMAGVSPNTIYRILTDGTNPQRRIVRKLADAFGVEARELVA